MKAAILTKLKAPLTVAYVEFLGGLGYGQVMVQISQSGICGAQLQDIRGEKGNAKFLPHCIGHEGVGHVTSIGAGVTRVRTGDKVVLHWRKAAGIESDVAVYSCPTLTVPVKGGKVTTFLTHSVVSENRVTPVPESIPDDLCALLGCGLSTALGTIEMEANLRMGETVMIFGAGGLGMNLVLAAKLRQASAITVVDIVESKRKMVEKAGAIFFTPEKLAKADISADVVIETSGSRQGIEVGLSHINDSGRFIMVGQPKAGSTVGILNARHLFEGSGKTIMATQGGRFQPHLDLPRYCEMFKAGLLNIKGLITHRVSLEDVNSGIKLVKEGQAGRVMVMM